MKGQLQIDASAAYRARDRGAPASDISGRLAESEAAALREAIEEQVPSVRADNARSQHLIGAVRALGDAEDRPGALGKIAALGQVGGALASGNPAWLSSVLGTLALDSPAVGASAGIALDRFSHALSNEQLQRAALLALMAGENDDADQ